MAKWCVALGTAATVLLIALVAGRQPARAHRDRSPSNSTPAVDDGLPQPPALPRAGGTARVEVRGSTGPVEGAAVLFRALAEKPHALARTDPRGVAAIEIDRGGGFEVVVRAAGFAAYRGFARFPGTAHVRLNTGATLRLAPVSRQEELVIAVRSPTGPARRLEVFGDVVDAGTWPPGVVTIQAAPKRRDLVFRTIGAVSMPQEGIVTFPVTLRGNERALRLRVLERASRRVVRDWSAFRSRSTPLGDMRWVSVPRGDDGESIAVPKNAVSIRVVAPGYSPVYTQVPAKEDETEILLDPAASILCRSAEPFAGRVRAFFLGPATPTAHVGSLFRPPALGPVYENGPEHPRANVMDTREVMLPVTAARAADAVVRGKSEVLLTGLSRDARYLVVASRADGASARAHTVIGATSSDASVVLDWIDSAVVELRVRRPNGVPAARARVTIHRSNGRGVVEQTLGMVTTDDNGACTVLGLAPGNSYVIEVGDRGSFARREFVLRTQLVEILAEDWLPNRAYNVAVLREDGSAAAGAQVVFRMPNGPSVVAVTDDQGHARVVAPVAGVGEFVASTGAWLTSKPVPVAAGVPIRLRLPSAAYSARIELSTGLPPGRVTLKIYRGDRVVFSTAAWLDRSGVVFTRGLPQGELRAVAEMRGYPPVARQFLVEPGKPVHLPLDIRG